MRYEQNKTTDLIEMGDVLNYNQKINEDDKTFEKLMFIYKMAIKEINTKIEIMQEQFKFLYNYNLIDHIDFRIKSPKSILKKMEDKKCDLTYKDMINNINDIAGIRVVCPLKKDIYSVKNLIQRLPGIETIKEKDYIKIPKESGYSAYHLILCVPVMLTQKIIYVKVEVQIKTIAMDFWSNLEHKMRYKPQEQPSKQISKELQNCAKVINKLDDRIMSINE